MKTQISVKRTEQNSVGSLIKPNEVEIAILIIMIYSNDLILRASVEIPVKRKRERFICLGNISPPKYLLHS